MIMFPATNMNHTISGNNFTHVNPPAAVICASRVICPLGVNWPAADICHLGVTYVSHVIWPAAIICPMDVIIVDSGFELSATRNISEA